MSPEASIAWQLDTIDEAITELERLVDTADNPAAVQRLIMSRSERIFSLGCRLMHVCQDPG